MNVNTVTQAVLPDGIQYTHEGYQHKRSDKHICKGIRYKSVYVDFMFGLSASAPSCSFMNLYSPTAVKCAEVTIRYLENCKGNCVQLFQSTVKYKQLWVYRYHTLCICDYACIDHPYMPQK